MEVGDHGLIGVTVAQFVVQVFNAATDIVTNHSLLMMETIVLEMAISILYAAKLLVLVVCT